MYINIAELFPAPSILNRDHSTFTWIWGKASPSPSKTSARQTCSHYRWSPLTNAGESLQYQAPLPSLLLGRKEKKKEAIKRDKSPSSENFLTSSQVSKRAIIWQSRNTCYFPRKVSAAITSPGSGLNVSLWTSQCPPTFYHKTAQTTSYPKATMSFPTFPPDTITLQRSPRAMPWLLFGMIIDVSLIMHLFSALCCCC